MLPKDCICGILGLTTSIRSHEETNCWNFQQHSRNLQHPQNSCSGRVAVVVACAATQCPRTEMASPSCEHHHDHHLFEAVGQGHDLRNSKSARKLPLVPRGRGKETNTQEQESLLCNRCADCTWRFPIWFLFQSSADVETHGLWSVEKPSNKLATEPPDHGDTVILALYSPPILSWSFKEY